jgi:hypothetical protein
MRKRWNEFTFMRLDIIVPSRYNYCALNSPLKTMLEGQYSEILIIGYMKPKYHHDLPLPIRSSMMASRPRFGPSIE